MTETTHRFSLPYIMPAQAQKHLPHNAALRDLDQIIHANVIDDTTASPPTSPLENDAYIVAADASGDWAGRTGQIALWQDAAWRFFVAVTGWLVWVETGQRLMVFHQGSWQIAAAGGEPNEPGTDGKSAYELAVDHGFSGTLTEWLTSLRGERGPAGTDGAPGPTGPQGLAGADGPAGADGADGPSAYEIWLAQGNTGTEADFLASLSGSSTSDTSKFALKAAADLNEALPAFPVTDGLALAFIPSLKISSIDFSAPTEPRITSLTDSATGAELAKRDLTGPELKYSSNSKLYYMETDGVASGLGIDDFPIKNLISADGHSASIVCISTLQRANQFNFGWIRKNSDGTYINTRRMGVHFPWGDEKFYWDFGSPSTGRVNSDVQTGLADNTTIRTICLTASETGQKIVVDNQLLAEGNPSDSFSIDGQASDETGYLSFGHLAGDRGGVRNLSEMRCFAFLIYNRALTDEEIYKINLWKANVIGDTI